MPMYRIFGYETITHEVEYFVEAESEVEAEQKVIDGDFDDSILGGAIDYGDLRIMSIRREEEN
jgi:hypothetical protein